MAGGALALSPLIKMRTGRAGPTSYQTKRVVILGIGGGLRLSESLGMSQGATMPNLFGRVPLVPGFGSGDAGDPRIAPEYAGIMPALVTPAPAAVPLHTQGTLVTNLRYAEGAPGHLQGQACLFSGAYNNIDNRADAHAPSPTLFEIHRRETDAPATDTWYVSQVGGFYRALQASDHPGFGTKYGGSFLSPPGPMNAIIPLVTSGQRVLSYGGGVLELPIVQDPPNEAAAARRLGAILDGNYPKYPDDGTFRSTIAENAAVQEHFASFYGDPSWPFYPDSVGIGMVANDGGLDATNDALTIYHTEKILERWKPTVTCVTLLDIDACHTDFNGYLRGQIIADACARHLWEFIQSTDDLRDETALIIMPEHGRHLFFNGQNQDSLGRSGIDHGQGDDGDRNVWLLALGPDFIQGDVIAPTGPTQDGRASGRWESIDATMLAAALLGYDGIMTEAQMSLDLRPGLVLAPVLR